MKITETRLCNKKENKFLVDNMTVYIEKEIDEHLSFDIDDFKSINEQGQQFNSNYTSLFVHVLIF